MAQGSDGIDAAHSGWKSFAGLAVGLGVVALLFGGGLVGFLAFGPQVPGGGGLASTMGSLIQTMVCIASLGGALVFGGLFALVWWIARKRERSRAAAHTRKQQQTSP